MCDEIPWDELFTEDVESATDNVADIMNGYCMQIARSSGERVHARFVELKLARKQTGAARLEQLLSQEGAIYEQNALPQRDINELYDSATYVFDIYNDKYQFRLCELDFGAMYPIEVTIDEGVEEEIHDAITALFDFDERSKTYAITNDEGLKRCFTFMITSRKAKSILRQLRKG